MFFSIVALPKVWAGAVPLAGSGFSFTLRRFYFMMWWPIKQTSRQAGAAGMPRPEPTAERDADAGRRERIQMLTKEAIRQLAGYSYERGVELYRQGMVHSFQVSGPSEGDGSPGEWAAGDQEDDTPAAGDGAGEDRIDAWVRGSGRNLYHVTMSVSQARSKIIHPYCTCPAFENYGGLCKHCVAVLLEYVGRQDYDRSILNYLETLRGNIAGPRSRAKSVPAPEPIRRETTWEIRMLFHQGFQGMPVPMAQAETFGKVRIEPTLICLKECCFLCLRLGVTRMYVLRDVPSFADAVKGRRFVSYGKNLAFVHSREVFSTPSRGLLDFLLEWEEENGSGRQGNAYGGEEAARVRNRMLDRKRYLALQPHQLERFLQSVGENPFRVLFPDSKNILVPYEDSENVPAPSEISDGSGAQDPLEDPDAPDDEYGLWRVFQEAFRPKLFLKAVSGGVQLRLGRTYFRACGRHFAFFDRLRIYLTPRDRTDVAEAFLMALDSIPDRTAFVAREDFPAFYRRIYPALQKFFICKGEGFLPANYETEPVRFRFYLDLPQKDFLTCDVQALYGEAAYSVYDPEPDSARRDLDREAQVGQLVSGLCNAYDDSKKQMAVGQDDALLYEFLTSGVERLRDLGEVFISDALRKVRVLKSPRVAVGVSLSGDLLNLSVSSPDMEEEQLLELLSRYEHKKRYYRLQDGSLLHMEDDRLDDLEQLRDGLQLSEKELRQGAVAVPRYRALFLEGQLRENEWVSVKKDAAFLELAGRLEAGAQQWDVPGGIHGTLRNYQLTGYRWIRTLFGNGLGGILADDMGLGKTLQVICFLQAMAEESPQGRCLIVCPASLVYNWKSEIERFAPELPVRMAVGAAQQREDVLRNLNGQDVLITSYDLLRRDLDLYKGVRFFCQVIDEAQSIKNHGTQAARAVKKIDAGFRLALTGTPVENRLSELWSIFDYLMPGYLYSYSRFRETLEVPIVVYDDQRASARLKKMIHPFVLRRLKKDVLQELPDKQEENLFVQMTEEQRQLYDAHVKRLQMTLRRKDHSERGKDAKTRLQVLAELTRLRQICCDPGLIYEGYQGGSAKLELALELVRNALANGRKVLLFSQFTSMLDRAVQALKKEKISYYLLTGATPKEERARMVESFAEDDVPVFCISLKAGGTGLNLTAADVVIHFDPWWNVAAQDQATDRAHRIGQRHTVNVYRLIARGTIEEKIIALQERKRQMADQVLGGADLGNAALTREELLELLEEM